VVDTSVLRRKQGAIQERGMKATIFVNQRKLRSATAVHMKDCSTCNEDFEKERAEDQPPRTHLAQIKTAKVVSHLRYMMLDLDLLFQNCVLPGVVLS